MKNTTDMEQDRQYMKMALELAQKGMGFTAPNPMVGAVIVKNGRIIGQGYHRKYGGLHADREALAACTEEPEGASIYVTLEPCCHYGKQPPCVNAILETGIRRVIIGSSDPNPLVAGKGIRILKDHGIEVTENILKEECDKLNEAFFYYIQNKKPYVVMKYAMTMDGKTAAYTGESKWVTGEAARIHVQKQRLKYTGIMVGVGTVLADDPMLTCRLENSRNPVRIICDSHLRTPLTSKIVRTAKTIPTILASSSKDQQKIKNYEELGTVKKIKKGANSAVFTIQAEKILDDLKTGDSVAVNGICLTVTACLENGFTADVMHETLNRSALIQLSPGQHVNLERAMPANGRFGGHIVAGHIDGTGRITKIHRDDNAVWYTIQTSDQIMKYIVIKGSVTIDGISLTVAKVSEKDFSISAIPHTVKITVLGERKEGDMVNLETDIIGKYVEKLITPVKEQPSKSNITRDFLSKYGF